MQLSMYGWGVEDQDNAWVMARAKQRSGSEDPASWHEVDSVIGSQTAVRCSSGEELLSWLMGIEKMVEE